jgi:hypothetical protein
MLRGRRVRGGSLSSAILYLGIVLIWACVLIPRWLRRDHSVPEPVADDLDPSEPVAPAGPVASSGAETGETDFTSPAPAPAPVRALAPGAERQRVLAARRRMLWMLLALLMAAMALAGLKLAAWWVVLPPTVMLLGYMLLLREAAHADAERAFASPSRARTRARPVVDATAAPTPAHAPEAEVIEFSAAPAVSADDEGYSIEPVATVDATDDGLYDQYVDARLRAVGD